jgi:hypothetical protein
MKDEKLVMFIWAIIIVFVGLIFALSFVHTIEDSQNTQKELSIQEKLDIYAKTEILNYKNRYKTDKEVLFLRLSTNRELKPSQIYVFTKEDLKRYSQKLKMEKISGDLFIVKASSFLELEELKIRDQVTNQEIPLMKYLVNDSYYIGTNITDNFCPGYKSDPNVIYHTFDCKEWGCKVEEVK